MSYLKTCLCSIALCVGLLFLPCRMAAKFRHKFQKQESTPNRNVCRYFDHHTLPCHSMEETENSTQNKKDAVCPEEDEYKDKGKARVKSSANSTSNTSSNDAADKKPQTQADNCHPDGNLNAIREMVDKYLWRSHSQPSDRSLDAVRMAFIDHGLLPPSI